MKVEVLKCVLLQADREKIGSLIEETLESCFHNQLRCSSSGNSQLRSNTSLFPPQPSMLVSTAPNHQVTVHSGS